MDIILKNFQDWQSNFANNHLIESISSKSKDRNIIY